MTKSFKEEKTCTKKCTFALAKLFDRAAVDQLRIAKQLAIVSWNFSRERESELEVAREEISRQIGASDVMDVAWELNEYFSTVSAQSSCTSI